jgi:hypothetical protein
MKPFSNLAAQISSLCLLMCLFAADQGDAIREEANRPNILFPTLEAEVTPKPVPKVNTRASAAVLSPNRFYVVSGEEKFFLLVTPPGVASVEYLTGPMKYRGIFADGTGKIETRTYPGKFLAEVTTDKTAGEAYLAAVPAGVQDEKDITRITVKIGSGVVPVPPPNPPDPTPPPGVPLDFVEAAKSWVSTIPQGSRGPVADVAHTFRDIGAVWSDAGSIEALETLLAVGIQASLSPLKDKVVDWKQFTTSADAALQALKASGASVEDYGNALQDIGKGMQP